MPAPVLIDVSSCSEAHTDAALEAIYKAQGEEPPGDDIWTPHPNPYLRRLVEMFTERGLARLGTVQKDLRRWLSGKAHKPGARRPRRPKGAMARWSKAEIDLTRLYLESVAPASLTLDDWMLLVEYLTQRYLPLSDLRSEADWLTTRANIMGRLQSAIGDATTGQADHYLAALPDPATLVRGMTKPQRAALEFGRLRCAEHVTDLAAAARRRMRDLVVNHQEAVFSGDLAGAAERLESKLLDEFGMLNRDWRRIAVTEAGENFGQGFVAAQAAGTRIKRVEQYRGACSFCRAIDGRIMVVVDASDENKNGETSVWVGKTNVGRSASPRKRVGGAFIEREPDERLWVAAGTMHPHCRGSWVLANKQGLTDPTFDAWLKRMARREPDE